jgi:hypothetical protein
MGKEGQGLKVKGDTTGVAQLHTIKPPAVKDRIDTPEKFGV